MKAMIVRKRSILGGKPIIAGTRIGVDDIARYLAYDYGLRDIQKAYPHLTVEQIRAALAYLNDATARQIQKLETTAV